jgi:hypothetical protein
MPRIVTSSMHPTLRASAFPFSRRRPPRNDRRPGALALALVAGLAFNAVACGAPAEEPLASESAPTGSAPSRPVSASAPARDGSTPARPRAATGDAGTDAALEDACDAGDCEGEDPREDSGSPGADAAQDAADGCDAASEPDAAVGDDVNAE